MAEMMQSDPMTLKTCGAVPKKRIWKQNWNTNSTGRDKLRRPAGKLLAANVCNKWPLDEAKPTIIVSILSWNEHGGMWKCPKIKVKPTNGPMVNAA